MYVLKLDNIAIVTIKKSTSTEGKASPMLAFLCKTWTISLNQSIGGKAIL